MQAHMMSTCDRCTMKVPLHRPRFRTARHAIANTCCPCKRPPEERHVNAYADACVDANIQYRSANTPHRCAAYSQRASMGIAPCSRTPVTPQVRLCNGYLLCCMCTVLAPAQRIHVVLCVYCVGTVCADMVLVAEARVGTFCMGTTCRGTVCLGTVCGVSMPLRVHGPSIPQLSSLNRAL